MNNSKLSFRHWVTFILVGLIGQFAWTIENMYLNRYIFHVTGNITLVPVMVAASAITATVTTLLMGALSDRVGKRKPFIFGGYLIWGLSIIGFAFLDPTLPWLHLTVFKSGVMVVVLDCVMTFFGSTANDAAFNAYVTDNTNTSNRGKTESILCVLPLISMLIIFGLFNGLTSESNPQWYLFFFIFGALTFVAGAVSIFLIPKDVCQPNTKEPYFKNIFYGFRPSVVKQHPLLYLSLVTFTLFSIAIQIFFPYFLIYIENTLHIKDLNFTITLGIVLVVSCIATVVVGLFMDKVGKNKMAIPALAVCALGAFLMIFAKSMAFIIPAGIVLISGYMISMAVLSAKVRDFTPTKEAGLFQGVRMIFSVLIPMVTGPYIGEALYKLTQNPESTYINEYGETVLLPNQFIFLGTVIMLLVAIVAVLFLIKKENKINEKLDIRNEK